VSFTAVSRFAAKAATAAGLSRNITWAHPVAPTKRATGKGSSLGLNIDDLATRQVYRFARTFDACGIADLMSPLCSSAMSRVPLLWNVPVATILAVDHPQRGAEQRATGPVCLE
jgi:hypothetical protein